MSDWESVPRDLSTLVNDPIGEITSLRAEVERLHADKDVRRSQERNTSYEASIAELEAENERLRALLRGCLSIIDGDDVDIVQFAKTVGGARAALGEKE